MPGCEVIIQVAGEILNKIDTIIIADERDPESEGMLLAQQYQAERAPFFIVERDGQAAEIYTVYFKLVKEVLENTSA